MYQSCPLVCAWVEVRAASVPFNLLKCSNERTHEGDDDTASEDRAHERWSAAALLCVLPRNGLVELQDERLWGCLLSLSLPHSAAKCLVEQSKVVPRMAAVLHSLSSLQPSSSPCRLSMAPRVRPATTLCMLRCGEGISTTNAPRGAA